MVTKSAPKAKSKVTKIPMKKSVKKAPKPSLMSADLISSEVTATPVSVTAVVIDTDAEAQVKISEKDFIRRLTEKLTHFDATMVLEAAMLTAGVARQEGNFKKRDAREICLALIKRGGPAFAVGTGIYREVIG